MSLANPEVLFNKHDIENFVPLKTPNVKVKTWQRMKKRENVKSMLKVYCNPKSVLRSSSPPTTNENTQITMVPHHLR